jgi:molecular chaperone GrpE
VVRDLRRIDPATGQVRDPGRAATAQQGGAPRSGKGSRPGRHAASKPGGTSTGASAAGNGPAGNGPSGNGPSGNGPSGNGPSGNGPEGSPAPDSHRHGGTSQGGTSQGGTSQGGTSQGGASQGGASQGAPAGGAAAGSSTPGDGAAAGGTPHAGGTGPQRPDSAAGPAPQGDGGAAAGGSSGLAERLAERTADLQRIGAEYANYRKRVERDRIAVREQALANVLQALLPVLDDLGRAREHGELVGGFKSVAESLETVVSKLGLASFGSAGEPFDPTVHEALMHSYSAEVSEPTAVQILQPGYKVGERILRPARVAVAEPETPGGGGTRQGTGGEAASGTAADGESRGAADGQPPGAAGAQESSEEDD